MAGIPDLTAYAKKNGIITNSGGVVQAANGVPDLSAYVKKQQQKKNVTLPTAEEMDNWPRMSAAARSASASTRQALPPDQRGQAGKTDLYGTNGAGYLGTFSSEEEARAYAEEWKTIQNAAKSAAERGLLQTSPLYAAGSSWVKRKTPMEAATERQAEPSPPARILRTLSGGAKGSLASNTNALANTYDLGQTARNTSNEWYAAEYMRNLEDAALALEQMREDGYSAADLKTQQGIVDEWRRKYNAIAQSEPAQRGAAEAAYQLADTAQRSSAEDIARAKRGLGGFGQMLVDAGAGMTQVGLDAAANAALGAQGMLPFALRAYGGGAQQARQDGADLKGASLYGAASAAKEVFTEKISNIALPFARAYGRGGLDKTVENVIEKAVDKLARTGAGKRLLGGGLTFLSGAVGEGLEEFIGDWMEWQLPRIYGGDVDTMAETLSNSLYDFAVGALSGAMGGAADVNTYRYGADSANSVRDLPTLEQLDAYAAQDAATAAQTVSPGMTAAASENAVTGRRTRESGKAQSVAPGETAGNSKNATIVEHLRRNAPALSQMQPVAELTGNELPAQGRASDRALAFLQSIGNKINRAGFGDVFFSRKNVKNSLVGHGMSQAKIETIAAVPNVIQNGVLLDHVNNYEGKGYNTYLFGAPVNYKGDPVLVGVVVAKDEQSGRYYVHEVVDSDGNVLLGRKKSEGDADNPSTRDEVVTPSDSADSIPNSAQNVKLKEFIDENGRTLTVAPTQEQLDAISRQQAAAVEAPEVLYPVGDPRNQRMGDIYKIDVPTAINTGVTAESGDTGTAGTLYSDVTILQPSNDVKSSDVKLKSHVDENGRTWTQLPSVVSGIPPEGVDADAFMEERMAKAKVTREERQRSRDAEDFTASPALEKLDVKIAGSVGLYDNIEQLVARNRASKKITRERQKAEKRLKPTEAEKNFARGVAAGLYPESEIPSNMRTGTVRELADYYRAENAANDGSLVQQRKYIYQDIDGKMEALFPDAPNIKGKRPGALVLNYRTPERNMRSIFGDARGKAINEYVFEPVAENEAERIRFENRMFYAVREFKDSEGKLRGLTSGEREIAQMVLEGFPMQKVVAAEEIRAAMEDAAREVAQDVGVNDKAMAPYLERWRHAAELLRSGEVDQTIINNAVKKYKSQYAIFYNAINDFLVAHGYDTIGWRAEYAPHMQPDENLSLFEKALKGLGLNAEVNNLPTEIAGLTASFKPNKQFDPHFLERTGHLTKFDIAEGYEEYVDYMSNVLYHTDDIMKVRRMSEYIRKAFAREEVSETLSWAMHMRYEADAETKADFLKAQGVVGRNTDLSTADAEDAFDKYVSELLQNTETEYGDLVTWLDNYANILAGKQSAADRGPEAYAGRKVLNAGNKLVQTFARSKVAGNLSSVLNQLAQWPMIRADLGGKWTRRAVADIATGKLSKAGWQWESDFLTEKRGLDYLVKTDGEKILSALFTPASVMDELVSTIAVRGKYLQELDAGKSHAEAMKAADVYGKSVMGSRAKGSKPVAFNSKNPLHQMINVFQIEALNSWEYLIQDKFGAEFRDVAAKEGKFAASAKLGAFLVKMLLSAFLINRLGEDAYGGTPAPFDVFGLAANFFASGKGLTTNKYLKTLIDNVWEKLFGTRLFSTAELDDDLFDKTRATKELLYNVSNDVPFFRNVSGVLGWGDNTLPIPNIYGGGKDVTSAIKNHGVLSGENAKAAGSLAAEFLPGGAQAKKTALGLEYLLRGGDFSGYGDNARLKYPTDGTVSSAVQALLFGKNATEASNAYYASGASALSAKATAVYQSMIDTGEAGKEAYALLRELGKVEKTEDESENTIKRHVLRKSDISGEGKSIVYYGLLASDKEKALMDELVEYSDMGEVTNVLMDIKDANLLKGTEASQAKRAAIGSSDLSDEAEMKIYRAMISNEKDDKIESFMDEGASFDDWLRFEMLTAGLEGDKDENGKTITDSKRDKVLAAIDSMELTDEQKNVLYYAAGYEESRIVAAPWNDGKYALPRLGIPTLTIPKLTIPDRPVLELPTS